MLRSAAVSLLILLSSSCGLLGEEIVCASPDTVLSQQGQNTLTCGDAAATRDYFQFLASRSLTPNQKGRLYTSLKSRHGNNPKQVRQQIDEATHILGESRHRVGLARAEFRSHSVWLARMSKGPFTEAHSVEWDIFENAVAVWARSDDEQLALTEMDIEGWIRFGSLCREVQGASPLRFHCQ